MYENAKNALRKAIRDFYCQDDILNETTLREAAQNFVYEHDEEVREHLREQIDLEDVFESVLDDIDWYEIW